MKRIALWIIIVCLVGAFVPAKAQAVDCDAEAIEQRMTALVAAYLSAQASATDGQDMLTAAADLQTAIADLRAACGGVSDMPTEGKWMLTWDNTQEQFCDNPTYSTRVSDRPVMLTIEDGDILLNDLFTWPVVRLSWRAEYYFYRRIIKSTNGSLEGGFDYVTTDIQSTTIEALSKRYYLETNCVLTNGFTVKLVNPDVICMIGSQHRARLYRYPNTNSEDLGIFGSLDAGKAVDVVGYAMDMNDRKWWRVAGGGWIRAERVKEAGRCEDVPEVAD